MNFETIESELAFRLASSNMKTMVLPEKLSDYKVPDFGSLVTIAFVSEKPQTNQSVSEVSQDTVISISLSVQSRFLRGVDGIYAAAESVKDKLIGYRPTDCGALQLVEHVFANYDAGTQIWEHQLTFSTDSIRSQIEKNWVPTTDITNGEEVFYDPINKPDENI